LVSVSHFAKAHNSPFPAGFERASHLGPIAVDIFFVISGFLITLLMLRERDRTGELSLTGFYSRRALRILPAYLAFLFVLFVLTRLGTAHLSNAGWAMTLTYTVNFVPKPPEWIGHVWSLSVEEHFYLLWPLLVFALSPRGSRRVLLGWIIACPLLRWLLWRNYGDQINLDQLTFTRLDTLTIGCFLAYFVREAWAMQLADRLKKWTTPAVLAAAGLFLVSNFGIHSGKYDLLFKRLVEGTAIAFIVFACVTNSSSLVGRILEWRPLVVVGVLSYSLYIWQPLLHPPAECWPWPWPVNVVATILAAVASYVLIERPFLRLKMRTHSEGRPEQVAPAVLPTGLVAGAG
jgi:peptidoglycan/LPS O-acetylase OafA/YrhL